MTNDRATEAREGLLDSVAGKAKEMAGAVTGKDDLVQEGQLQQEEARNRKEVVAEEAIAEAKAEHAAEQYRQQTHEAAELKDQARGRADREEQAAERERAQQRQAADRQAAAQEELGREAAEERADDVAESRLREADQIDAAGDVARVRADTESTRLEGEAAAAEQQAARLRAQTEK